MPQYLRSGSIPAKRHTVHALCTSLDQVPSIDSNQVSSWQGYKGEGIYYEEVITTQGFSRAYSIAYHLRPPTRVRKVEPAGIVPLVEADFAGLRHVHLTSAKMPHFGDPITGRVPLFFNSDIVLSRCRPCQTQQALYRNALADELIFVQSGRGRVRTMFGSLPFRPMDYIVIPKCCSYEILVDDDAQSLDALVVEAIGSLGFPPRYLNPDGQFRLGAPFCERDLHGPIELETVDQEGCVPLLIKDGIQWTRYELANHPFDVVGWDGMVYPFTFNADDFEPITGKIHQPPPIHQTFQATGFVVCTFAPRLLDSHPDAIKVPYAHSNVESDEVLYYVRGQFGSRRGVEVGSLTLHPHGIPHGPHPGTIMASRNATFTDELAVMVDTFKPLKIAQGAIAFDDSNYPYSWLD